MKRIALIFCFFFPSVVFAQDYVYTIGNSLTNDVRPQFLDDCQWHIYCSRNLDFIFNNPFDHCLSSSNPWPNALTTEDFQYVSVQPFEGTTLEQDRDIIALWMALQPGAVFVIHSGWTRAADFPTDYLLGNPDDMMLPTPEYMSDLIDELKRIYPDRLIVETHANDLLFSVWEDIQNGIGPYSDFRQDIFRDFIHMDLHTGRYLMHNAMRYAIRQPLFDRREFPNTSNSDAIYLNYKIREILVVPGDINRDDVVDLLDVNLFIETLIRFGYDICADVNSDGVVNFFDIVPFVELVTH